MIGKIKAERTQPERTYRSNESRNNNFNRQPQRQNSRVERPHMEQRQVRTQQTRQVERNTTPQRQSVRTQPQQTRKVERSHQPQRKSSEVTQRGPQRVERGNNGKGNARRGGE